MTGTCTVNPIKHLICQKKGNRIKMVSVQPGNSPVPTAQPHRHQCTQKCNKHIHDEACLLKAHSCPNYPLLHNMNGITLQSYLRQELKLTFLPPTRPLISKKINFLVGLRTGTEIHNNRAGCRRNKGTKEIVCSIQRDIHQKALNRPTWGPLMKDDL